MNDDLPNPPISYWFKPKNWRREIAYLLAMIGWRMVKLGADVCLAFPLGASNGTRQCMEAAAAAGIPVLDYGPAVAQ